MRSNHKPPRGWIRVPIYHGFLNAEHRAELRRQADAVAERLGAEVINDFGERAELDVGVHPARWVRFHLFQIQRLARKAR